MASYQKYETKTKGKMWLFIVEGKLDPLTGKRERILRRGFKTKKDAQTEAIKIEHEIASSSYLKETEMLFEEFVDEWFKLYKKTGVKESTINVTRANLNSISNHFKNEKLKDITQIRYNKLLIELSEKYSLGHVKNIHSMCRMIFRKAIDFEMIKKNPTENAKIPKKSLEIEDVDGTTFKSKFLEKGELKHFLKVAKLEGLKNDYVLIAFLAYSGMRIGEALALQWCDIDFDKNSIRINKTLFRNQNNKYIYKVTPPKTRSSVRVISMDENVMNMLNDYRSEQNDLIVLMGESYKKEGYVFTYSDGVPLLSENVILRMKRLAQKSGINKNITPHTFRHTHTSLLLEAGVGVKEIQRRLGHSNIQTTLNIYSHMTQEMEIKATNKFSELMGDL